MQSDTEILGRLVKPGSGNLSPAAAEGLLSLQFSEGDVRRMNDLAAMAREGTLSSEQKGEAESYNRVGHLVAVLHSKARLSLKTTSDGGDGR